MNTFRNFAFSNGCVQHSFPRRVRINSNNEEVRNLLLLIRIFRIEPMPVRIKMDQAVVFPGILIDFVQHQVGQKIVDLVRIGI